MELIRKWSRSDVSPKSLLFCFWKRCSLLLCLSQKYWNCHGFTETSFRRKDSDSIPAALGEAIALYWDVSKVTYELSNQATSTLAVLGKNALVFMVRERKWICILGRGRSSCVFF